ncbi:MAG TPA: branched-chain amino acid ABC transporter permease [Thermoanaerobaculia bacterium]|nr:branched-chain amino acid ABC transporter permease [Thermoanaerobaculia bacterium]
MTAPGEGAGGKAAGGPASPPGRASRAAPFAAIVLAAALAAVPLFGLGPNTIRLLFVTLVWMTASVAWNLLGGFGGQVSFGFAVFYGLGAYAAAMALNAGLDPFSSCLLGAGVAAAASLAIGLPTFRLKGPYFAIATIGVSEAVRVVMTNVQATGGASGYRVMERGAFHQLQHFYSALALAAAAVAVSVAVRRSRLGLALVAIREDQEGAADLGVNPLRAKLLAHAIAAALTGAAGGIHARYAAYVNPQGEFAFAISVAILLMPIIGGVGTIWGPVVGACFYGLVHEEIIAAFPQLHLLIYGSLLILIVLFEPAGIVGLVSRLAHAVNRGRRRRVDAAP